ncbi:MAG: hypothetical protein DMG14_21965 [Acidobacteria bacterium]|nr:MAG: hypothetical protein DMG14_21965 [Acidobacteriota bacterium]
MKIVDLKKRLRPNRRSETVSIAIPDDILTDLDRVRAHLGFSSIEALIRAYVGQGLRADLERLEAAPNLTVLIDTLRRHGVDEKVIAVAMREAEMASTLTRTARQSKKARRD